MSRIPRDQPHEHETSLGEIGFGFGQLDYFCTRCGALTKSVPLAEMSDKERHRVGVLAGRTIGRWGDLGSQKGDTP